MEKTGNLEVNLVYDLPDDLLHIVLREKAYMEARETHNTNLKNNIGKAYMRFLLRQRERYFKAGMYPFAPYEEKFGQRELCDQYAGLFNRETFPDYLVFTHYVRGNQVLTKYYDKWCSVLEAPDYDHYANKRAEYRRKLLAEYYYFEYPEARNRCV